MGLSGLEPPTSRLSGVRSNRLSYKPLFALFKILIMKALNFHSGDGEIRTLDPLLARQVLSQLSYTPIILTDAGLPFSGYPYLLFISTNFLFRELFPFSLFCNLSEWA